MANTPPLEKQKQLLDNLLQKLGKLIKKLPGTRPCGTKEGPIAKHFTSHEYDATEGPYFTFNQSLERVFQCLESEKEHLVIWGKYGLEMVQAYLACFVKYDGIEKDNGLQLVAQRVEALIALIEAMYVATPVLNQVLLIKCIHRKSKETPKMDTRKPNPGKRNRGQHFGIKMHVNMKMTALVQNQTPARKQTTKRTTLKRSNQPPRAV
jgi:hypothetical protein